MDTKAPLEVAINELSPEAVAGVIDGFICREGTDYGWNEISHEQKIRQITGQLNSGLIKIVFDPNTESVTLMTKLEFKKRTRATIPSV